MKTILFVGSFREMAKDGSVGGQMFASNTIIKSDLNKHFNWILLDTTALSNKKSNFITRLIRAVIRLMKFTHYVLFYKIDKILIFVGDGWSFWEKGLMVYIAKYFSKSEAILAPRSGFLENDILYNIQLKSFIIKVLNKADKVVCQSEKWRNIFSSLTINSYNKYVIIENGIDSNPYIEFPIQEKQYKNSTITILFLSWVDKNKGIFDLLEAVLLLRKNQIKFKLIIAGNGIDFEKAKKFVLINNLTNQISFVGWAYGVEKFKLLQNADIFVLPTHFEGYPNSLLEAMLSGKACLATSVGSIPDMVRNNKSGILVDKQNPNEIYKALNILITDDKFRKTISLEARNEVSNRNSIEAFVKKFKELLIS